MNLHRFINEHLEEILAQWESFARTLIPAADGMSSFALREHADELLHAISLDIGTGQDSDQQEEKSQWRELTARLRDCSNAIQRAAALHGEMRQRADFTLLQVCAEYRALRASVLRLWMPHLREMTEASAYEMLRFNEAIDQAMTEAAATFSAEVGTTQRLFQAILGVSDHAMYTLSPTGHITHWNLGGERTKGYTRQEVIGTNFERFFTAEARAVGLPEQALEIASRQGRYENEGWRLRKGGSRFWAHIVIDPIRNEADALVGYATVTRDLTETRKATAELERANEELLQSQKLQALGKLTGGVAHDFNNLLAVMVSGTELLAREVQSPSGTRVLATMQRASTRGAALTQQLLSFARQQPLQQKRFNLNDLIAAFMEVLRRAGNELIEFELHLNPGLCAVMVDAAQFEACVLNLVANARDAMPAGGTLSIRTQNVELISQQVASLSAGHYVVVTVSDTGHGMSAAIAAKAMDPFFTTKEQGKGTGMGLSQVYGLLRQSGGDMMLTSRTGHGTSVSLYLPALDATDATILASPDTNAGNDKALIVDDQPDVLQVAVELFKTLGYDVLSATNGEEALDKIRCTPDLDVLFSDIRMPGIDGFTLGREARKLLPPLKIILVSGFSAPAAPQDDAELTGVEFLKKPYRLSEVVRLLRRQSQALENLSAASAAA